MRAGFGLERLGLLSLRWPKTALAAAFLVAILALVGLARLEFNSDIRETFRSDSQDYAELLRMTRQYPSSDRDILLLVEGRGLIARENLGRLRSLHLDLRFAGGVTGVLSLFSARQPPDRKGNAAPLVPARLTAASDFAGLEAALLRHPVIAGKLLSGDASLALFVITLDGRKRSLEALRSIVAGIDKLAGKSLGPAGIEHSLTGVPVMRIEIIGALIRDQMVLVVAGFSIALFVGWLFLRRLRYIAIVAAPPLAAVTWLFGVMWAIGQELNAMTNVVPTLIIVLTLSNALHLLFCIRRKIGEAIAPRRAIEEAVREVGPACVLTSLTTAIALSSLILVPQPFVSRFGLTAALGVLLTYVAVMVVVPPLALLLLGGKRGGVRQPVKASPIPRASEWLSRSAARAVVAHPRRLALLGVVLFAACAVPYALNEPHYIYREYLPTGKPAFKAITRIDEKLAGTSTIRVLVQFPPGADLLSPGSLAAVAQVHGILAAVERVNQVWSLHSLAGWAAGGGRPGDALKYLRSVRPRLEGKLISSPDRTALVSGQFVDIDASLLIPVLARLEARLSKFGAGETKFEAILTGVTPVAVKSVHNMISRLNRSLLIAIVVIVVLIGLALRSAFSALVSILPNLLPIAAAGSALYFAGSGLQMTAVVAFTIGFGIAVDSTIHVLIRYRLERARNPEPAAAMGETITTIGPVLIVSTVVLTFGIGVTLLSAIPVLGLFGQISGLVLVVALLGDLLFLPAILLTAANLRARSRP
ncbi:MAG: efflux RND transporter permease subunit [Alphaproteobacteria bacterium]